MIPRQLALRQLLNAPFHHRDIDEIVADELRGGNIVQEEPDTMLNSLFPDEELPESIDTIYDHLKNVGLIVKGRRAFPFAPTLTGENLTDDSDEKHFSKFVNDLCAEAKKCFKKSPRGDRVFTGKYSSMPLRPFDVNISRKPDILVIDSDIVLDDDERPGDRLRWLEVAGYAELK